ncbi:MAG: twin-arginine translocase subunit TatC [Sandaracinaceae bacterium]|nr:twin-arginine translocase subunit TatC [Sandaracinaceae bacterium]
MAEPELEEEDKKPEDDVEMSFFEHLAELRTRLIRALAGILPGVAVGWIFRETVFEWLAIPWNRAHANTDMSASRLWFWFTHPVGDPSLVDVERVPLHYTGPMDPFVAYLVMAAIVGLLLASPWVFWQLWGFIAPGLYRRERRLALPFVFASTVMFTFGVYFGFTLVLPLAYQIFLDYGGDVGEHVVLTEMVTMDSYLMLTSRLLIAFGLTFEVPVVITFLSFAGVLNWRQLVRFGRWWLVISTVLAAILTPPDPASQIMMAVPLNVFYWISVGLAWAFGPKVDKVDKDGLTEDGYER